MNRIDICFNSCACMLELDDETRNFLMHVIQTRNLVFLAYMHTYIHTYMHAYMKGFKAAAKGHFDVIHFCGVQDTVPSMRTNVSF